MSLTGKVALVTGASRGIGRGIAIELGTAGATVYITGRKPGKNHKVKTASTLEHVVEEIAKKGGKGIAVHCDHSNYEEVEKLFLKIQKETHGHLDILVNNAFAGIEFTTSNVGKKFFELKEKQEKVWDIVNDVGLKNHYVCSSYAARMMAKKGSGLIVIVSSAGGMRHIFNVPYGVGKDACDRLAADLAVDLKGTGVSAISIWPGAVKTELINETVFAGKSSIPKSLYDGGESVYFAGKCIVKLAGLPILDKYNGKIVETIDLANEYNIVDTNGKKPNPDPTWAAERKKFIDFINDVRTTDL
ncbi:unnamed protein product [Bursaphelenchus xylophilus]|uniref:(pine wood nematode) hypothetical protein n=1 Tax=Bursaphelenchus xylophilus TaxID=6326 RepID=A0A1I7RTE7_BURXY|nr:unnamed protein product [Bursaphelenchus xylophilus]CAG9122481.1 unnamed protein product [Bursaphelenchus xylophilus]